jgi:hypothetical protein
MRNPLLLAAVVAAASLSACATSRSSDASVAASPTSPAPTHHPFEVEGTVRSVGGGLLGMGRSVTIARDQAPNAQLHVVDNTRIVVNDRPAKLSDVREGDEVRALFDFDGGTPVAIEIDAKPRR